MCNDVNLLALSPQLPSYFLFCPRLPGNRKRHDIKISLSSFKNKKGNFTFCCLFRSSKIMHYAAFSPPPP